MIRRAFLDLLQRNTPLKYASHKIVAYFIIAFYSLQCVVISKIHFIKEDEKFLRKVHNVDQLKRVFS